MGPHGADRGGPFSILETWLGWIFQVYFPAKWIGTDLKSSTIFLHRFLQYAGGIC